MPPALVLVLRKRLNEIPCCEPKKHEQERDLRFGGQHGVTNHVRIYNAPDYTWYDAMIPEYWYTCGRQCPAFHIMRYPREDDFKSVCNFLC